MMFMEHQSLRITRMTTMVRMVTPNTNISTGSIKTDFLKDNAVTTAKITDYSVTPGKISLPTEVGDKVLTFDNTTGTVDWSSKYTYQDEDVDAGGILKTSFDIGDDC